MHLPLTLIFVLGSASLAAPATYQIQARDAKTVTSALGMVTKSVNNLDQAVMSLNSPTDAVALGNIATMSQVVGDTVKKAQTIVEGTGPVSLFTALQVMQSADALTDALTTTTTDLVAKKPLVDQAGLSSVVGMMLMMQRDASSGLSGAVADQVPAFARPIAMGSAKKVTEVLDVAIKAYMGPAAVPAAAPAAMSPVTPPAMPVPIAAALPPANATGATNGATNGTATAASAPAAMENGNGTANAASAPAAMENGNGTANAASAPAAMANGNGNGNGTANAATQSNPSLRELAFSLLGEHHSSFKLLYIYL
ncbi:hypothetical protein FKW77_004386 [Venturia effusa]|uniref:Cell wall protein n=1 Tax=Venturia effusa TaxID=50376 RepID=A0A517LH11_9PEZI|nr:hypothetical protein FKW77_004386 [Venturia effusa]